MPPRLTSPRPSRQHLFENTTLAESIAHLFSRANQQDLCRRCYTTTTVVGASRSGANGSCTPTGKRRHPFVQGEAVSDPPEWTPAEPPRSGRRHGPGMEGGGVGGSSRRTAAAGVLSLQVRFLSWFCGQGVVSRRGLVRVVECVLIESIFPDPVRDFLWPDDRFECLFFPLFPSRWADWCRYVTASLFCASSTSFTL